MNKDPIETSFAEFQKLLVEIEGLDKAAWSEADTRLKVIDRVLFGVLLWDVNEAKVEDRAGARYTDYTLRSRAASRCIVEAKKDGVSFDLSNRQSAKAYKLNGPVFSAEARAAIEQAITYAAFKNCELACATNGNEWIVFRANRLGDGQETLDGKAFVFASLGEVAQNFKEFFDLMSRPAVESLRFRGAFQSAEGLPIRDLSFFKPARAPGSRRLLPRGDFAADFDAIMASFFERLKGDQDEDMIRKCFVVTPESRIADEKLSRIAEDLVGKIRQLDTDTGRALIDLIEAAKLQQRNRFVLLVGNKGAGKSTFIDRFFKHVLPAETADGLVVLRVDLATNSGDVNGVVPWLNQRLMEECERVVFTKESPDWDWNEVVGKMFYDDYQRWSTGTMSHLYRTDRDAFKVEFGRHVERIRTEQPHEYIKRLVAFITKSNKKIPCLVFDNTDHFTIHFQEAVFQYARSIYESEFCIVLVPITDKTSWLLSKQGALQSFESEALFLPVPRPERVIERRIDYLLEKLRDDDKERRKSYFLSRGIRLRIEDIAQFAESLNRLFVDSKETARWIGGLANHDIRRLLELTKEVIASPHLKLDDLLKAHIANTSDAVPAYRIKQAIVKRRFDIYPAGEHSFVQNVFNLTPDVATTPLLSVRILEYLRNVGAMDAEDEHEFVDVESVFDYFTTTGIHSHVTRAALDALLQTGLVFNYDPTILSANEAARIEASPSGRVHLAWATLDIEYLQMMKDVTPLRDKTSLEHIISTYGDYKKLWRASIRTFIEYLLAEDANWCVIPDHPNFSGQHSVTRRLARIAKQLRLEQGELDKAKRQQRG